MTDVAYVLEASDSLIEIGAIYALVTTAFGLIAFFLIFFGGSWLLAQWLVKWR